MPVVNVFQPGSGVFSTSKLDLIDGKRGILCIINAFRNSLNETSSLRRACSFAVPTSSSCFLSLNI